MSIGGDFYDLSDNQLLRLLNDELYYGDFLYSVLDEKPRECFSSAEYFWYELTELLYKEEVRGMQIAKNIPEAAGYSFSRDVRRVSEDLSKLDVDIIRHRFDCKASLMQKITYEQMLDLVKELSDFFQRAVSNGDAVLFRIT